MKFALDPNFHIRKSILTVPFFPVCMACLFSKWDVHIDCKNGHPGAYLGDGYVYSLDNQIFLYVLLRA